MKSKKIFNRLLFSFIVVLSITIIISVIGIIGLFIGKSSLDETYSNQLMSIKYAGDINSHFLEADIKLNKFAVSAITSEREQCNLLRADFDKVIAAMNEHLSEYDEIIKYPDERALFDTVTQGSKDYINSTAAVFNGMEAAINDNNDPILDGIAQCDVITKKFAGDLETLIGFNVSNAEKNYNNNNALSLALIIVMIAALLIGIAATVILVYILCVGIERDLKTIVSKLIVSTGNIDKATTQLNEASENLAGGSSRQAASLEETSATMNESASMIAQNAENTRQASQIAKRATEISNLGMKKMDEMVESMDQIKESSDTISRIVKVIDDIAFQTNLLAINATVEAARAGGDAGRSFAVVADEVRNLAQKSAKAASETTDIIDKNISLTGNGREVSRNVSESLKEITKETESLSRIINEINAASEEQATGIKQINIALSQMEKVTQDNAAVAEENAASTQSMKNQINNLQNAVNIAEGIIRDPSSIKSFVDKEIEEQGRSLTVKYTEKSKTYEPKSSTSNYNKPSSPPSSSSSSNKKNEADKIIPLDDDDNF